MNAIQTVAAALFVAVLAMPMSAYAVEEVQDVMLEAQATDPHPATFTSCSVSPKVAKVGDAVTISYEVSDPDGVASVSPIFQHGEGSGYTSFFSTSTSDTTKSFDFKVDGDTEPGLWRVVGLRVYDSMGFATEFGSSEYAAYNEGCIIKDFSGLEFEVQASTDPHPATFTSCSVSSKVAKVGDTVTISYEVSDPDGVASVSPIFQHGDGSGFMHVASLSKTDTTKEFLFKVDGETEPGIWHVAALEVRDSTGYVTKFATEEYAKQNEGCMVVDLSAATFEVQASTDPHPATFKSCSAAPKVAYVGDTVMISYDVSDPDGVASVSPIFQHGDGSGFMHVASLSKTDTTKEFLFKVDGETEPGIWHVAALEVRDSTGYVTTFASEEYAKQNDGCVAVNLSAATFEVLDEISSRTYEVLEGDNSVWTVGSNTPLTIRFAGPYDQFAGLTVDNVGVPEDLYEAESGSTVVKLSASYLETLGEGEHKVTAKYKDGSTSTATMKIQAASAGSGGAQDQGSGSGDGQDQGDQNQGTSLGSNGGTSTPATGTRQTTTLAKTSDDQTAVHLGLAALVMGSLAMFGASRRMGRGQA